jgi:hypothetical protein
MRRFLTVITILLIAALAVSMFAGCSKGQKGVSSSTSPGNPTAGGMAKSAPAVSGNPVAQIFAKQKAMSSYVQIMDVNGRTVRSEVKLQDGKPIRIKIDTGENGMVLVQYDKKIEYIVDAKTNTAMEMPATSPLQGGATSGGQSSMSSMSDAAKMKNMKATDDTLDGVDCWKVTRTDSDVVFWSEKRNGLAVQIERGAQITKLKYEQLNSVPDSEFELPARVKVQQMPKMPAAPQGMPKGMQMPAGH